MSSDYVNYQMSNLWKILLQESLYWCPTCRRTMTGDETADKKPDGNKERRCRCGNPCQYVGQHPHQDVLMSGEEPDVAPAW
jgi:hypothetical protein